MKLNPFKLERYFALYEFKIEHLMSSSDCDGFYQKELLEMASPDSLKLWDDLKLNYTESAGHPILREKIAGLVGDISADNVVVGVPEELIFVAMNVLLKPNDHVIVISPTYQSLYSIASDIGCEVSEWRLHEKEGKWTLDLDELEDELRANTKMVVVNFPNNPTGYLPSRAFIDDLIELARKHDLIIFSDEMYRLLENDPANRLPSLTTLYDRAVALSGLSKSFALPGIRIGWLTSQNKTCIERFIAFKDFTTICNSASSEILGIIALENTEKIIARNQRIVQRNLEAARTFFLNNRWFQWIEPNAGSICYPKWLGKRPIQEFCEELVEKHGIMIVPGTMFDTQEPHFRIGLGRKNFISSLEILDDVMKEYTE